MFNVALGWAFLLSVAASPGGKFLAAVFETSALRTIPSYQVALAGVFANSWVSTLLIYILLVSSVRLKIEQIQLVGDDSGIWNGVIGRKRLVDGHLLEKGE